jgi:GSCFA family
MEFKLDLDIKPSAEKLNLRESVVLIGSCFTEHMAEKLRQYKFNVLENPHGILFNPQSISQSVTSYISKKKYQPENLFYHNELWASWEYHSRFSRPDQDEALKNMNRSQEKAHDFLRTADWIMFTLGSAFVYQLENGEVVANCHKVPNDKFQKRLLQVEEVLSVLDNLIHRLFLFNPKLRIIFTISPVRHLRDGFIENNRSKAVLIQAVHHLINKLSKLYYFPAYELVIDDLRDYRFYAEDMVHPNYLATDYVWEKFSESFIDEQSKEIMKEVNSLNAAKQHKPFQPNSSMHQKFLLINLRKAESLQKAFPFLDLSEEIDYFSGKTAL